MSTPSPGDRSTPEDLTEYERADFPRGIPDSARTLQEGGAANARSALTLRLVLAGFGLVLCVVLGVLALVSDVSPAYAVVLFVLAAVALVDLVVVARRKRSGEPG